MSTILEVKNLKAYFPKRKGLFARLTKTASDDDVIKAVDGVDLTINQGETLALVGESGCGKTTLGKTILRISKAELIDGVIRFNSECLSHLDTKKLKDKQRLREMRHEMQMLFQHPGTALNPAMRIGDTIEEAVKLAKKAGTLVHEDLKSKADRTEFVIELLKRVKLTKGSLQKYPDELSGGQQRRVEIAKILAINPDFIVADEPVSGLDVSLQDQVLGLLEDLRQKRGQEHPLTYLVILHDLNVVKRFSNRVAVMYLGKIVEQLPTDKFTEDEVKHPYTKALISSMPQFQPLERKTEGQKDHLLKEDILPRKGIPPGCRFHSRPCPEYLRRGKPSICKKIEPEKLDFDNGSHQVFCHFAKEL